MVQTVFEFIYSLLICLVLIEIGAVLFVSVHEMFSEKRKQMKEFYKNKRKGSTSRHFRTETLIPAEFTNMLPVHFFAFSSLHTPLTAVKFRSLI